MIARFHYDDKTLAQLLRDEPAYSRNEISEHVETCDECQTRLETITQEGLTWEEAGALLRVDPLDELTGVSFDASDVKTSTAFLRPSDHPGSLGRFGRYEIMEVLGRGGMGIVMRGFDPALNRHSAVKVLVPELASSAAARKRFSREAKSAAAVVHPHVVPIQTVDEHDGLPYLVMPVVEGKSLQQRVDQDGPLPIVEVVRIASQIAEGLAAAHTQGLVHRDIKPANILLENGVERVQITDFGLARAADDASMTRSGVIAGTPQYMSPEQAHGDDIDHRSDLFSLGSVMYFMLTGRSPFRAENTMGVLNRIANDEPRRLRSIQPEIPIWLESIVVKLLEKDPENRFESARSTSEELNRRLAQLQDPSYQEDQPESVTHQSIPPTIKWIAVAGAAMAAALYLTILLLQTKDGTIRIETNGDLTTSVPLVIKQGDEVVERLTVDSDGATTRVRAGSYSIEFDGDSHSFELANNKATVKAGGEWTTKIQYQPGGEFKSPISEDSWQESNDPDVIRSLAVEDTRFSRYEASLEKILWCWDNAVKANPAWSAVRRSFLISDWVDLAENYPPALEKLVSIRNELEERVLSKDQVRVRMDDFADVAAINATLRQEQRTIDLFNQIKKRDPQDAERVKYYLPKVKDGGLSNSNGHRSEVNAVLSNSLAVPTHSIREQLAHDAFDELKRSYHGYEAEYSDQLAKARSDSDRAEVHRKLDPREILAPKYQAVEQSFTGTHFGLECLREVVSMAASVGDPESDVAKGRIVAVDRLIDFYAEHPAIGMLLDRFSGGPQVPRLKELLQKIVDRNPVPRIRAAAIIAQIKLIRQELVYSESIDGSGKARADQRLRDDANERIELLANDYADVSIGVYGTGASAAKHFCFAINDVVVGRQSPELVGQTTTNESFRLSDQLGNVVAIVFGQGGYGMSSDSTQDDFEMRNLFSKLIDKYKNRPVKMVYIMDGRISKSIDELAKQQKSLLVIANTEAGKDVMLDWGIDTFPSVYVVDQKGILGQLQHVPFYGVQAGYDTEGIELTIDALLAKANGEQISDLESEKP